MSVEHLGAEVPYLPEAYRDARKAYGIVSALLIGWELVGIEFEASPIESIKITLKSPEAIPYVLVVLVTYFAFRLTIEWFQAHPQRRSMRASKVDFTVAHVIGISSLILYAVQALLEMQLATKFTPELMGAVLIGLLASFGSQVFYGYRFGRPKRVRFALQATVLLVYLVCLVRWVVLGETGRVFWSLAGFLFSTAVDVALFYPFLVYSYTVDSGSESGRRPTSASSGHLDSRPGAR